MAVIVAVNCSCQFFSGDVREQSINLFGAGLFVDLHREGPMKSHKDTVLLFQMKFGSLG